ncbi:efflux RND transporter periplasmic adaptor subunit [Anaerobiospirillum sp. NML120448]|uniref:efflux RND transporter periplasmic adaptor subunit n=1 Tax=Anaerobiospirillum sp. NML120448 TaxID=2932816 RepID=UPI001FF14F8F|nr:efflux RND transporter periplasmic adaptor subunit [Anaerobiospirillum sp. NML120448]MCK0515376.1 efflux RND transporter periplasmic adaptor subunit [Anaerobiospirillum sp. NML120448]
MKRKQVIKYGVLGALVLALVGYFVYDATKEVAPTYMSATPLIRDIEQKVYATGTIAGKVSVDVGAQVSGQIKKLYVAKGDKVKAGDLLCEIDPEIQENNLRRAKAEQSLINAQIRSKKAQITMLKAEHIRQQNLLKKQATSTQSAQQATAQYEMALADLDALQAQYEQAAISVDDATTNLGYTKIVAPMDGTVYAIPVEEGQTVNANQTTPTIVRLADLETMTVEAEISEADVVKVQPDMECRFTIMGLPNRYFNAKLRSIDPAPASAESSTSTNQSSSSSTEAIYYNALLDVDNKDGVLRIDMTAEVEITIAKASQVKAIPIAAVKNESSDNKATVYQLINGQVTPKTVEIGVRDDQYIEVKNEDFDISIPLVIGDDVATAAFSAAAARRGPRMY